MLPKKGSKDRIQQIRAAQRYITQGLRCVDGQLQDLSVTGMRFELSAKPDFKQGHVQTWSICSENQRLNLTGRVVWIRKQGVMGKTFQIGIQFLKLKPAIQKAIEEFAVHGFIAPRDENESAPAKKPTPVRVKAPDLYAVLGIEHDATPDELREGFRNLAKTTHPDVCENEDAADRFDLINKAYEVLSDPDLRRQYDARYGPKAA